MKEENRYTAYAASKARDFLLLLSHKTSAIQSPPDVMASIRSSTTTNRVHVSKAVAKLLQREAVMVDFFGKLMDVCLAIDRNSIATGEILVTHGDPGKVSEVIDSIVGEIDVHAEETDEEVLNVLNLLKEKFPGNIETNFEQSNSKFKVAFHRKIKNEVEPGVSALATKTDRFLLSRLHMNYLQCHQDRLQEQIRRFWPDCATTLSVLKEGGQGIFLLSSKRLHFQDIKNFFGCFVGSIRNVSRNLEPSRVLFLSGTKGHQEVRQLEKENNCRITVHLPGHQLFVRAESPTGHRLFLCEGNMAATDCSVLLLPFSENQRDWPPDQKLALDRGLLASRTDLYAGFIGRPPKQRTCALQCQGPRAPQTVVVFVYIPNHQDCNSALSDSLNEALQLSCARGARIAVPVVISARHSLIENLKSVLPVILRRLGDDDNMKTIVLYLDKSPAAEKQALVETLEQTLTAPWKTQTDVAAVYENNWSSSPSVTVCGQTQDVETAFTKLQGVLLPADIEERTCLITTAIAGFGAPSQPVIEGAKLFGKSAKKIRKALQNFDDLVKDKFTRKEIVDDVIENMIEEEIQEIRKVGRQHSVELQIQNAVGRIVIDGMQANVFDAGNEINKIIREADRRRQQEQQALMLVNMVQWCYLEGTSTGTKQIEYKERENRIIESAYQARKKSATIKDVSGTEYIIDFDSMKEYPASDPRDTVDVIRKDKMKESFTGVLPENWTIQPDKKFLKLAALDSKSPEYYQVKNNFRATLGRNKGLIVSSIDRIENPTQYRQYMAKKAHLDKQNAGIQNERILWHGTSSDALSNINNYGFNRSYCGKNAVVYGQGVYFAVNSESSTHPTYSPPDRSTGHRYIYQCRVLVGHPVQGNSAMRILPARSGHILYDSSTDNLQNPALYAIFNDTQAYPEYLITFR